VRKIASVILRRRYELDSDNPDMLAGLLSSLAAEAKKPEEEYIPNLLGDYRHLYYYYGVTNNYKNLSLPDILYSKVKKIIIFISSRSVAEGKKMEDYLEGQLYARWEEDKNIVTFKRKPVFALIRVDMIMLGKEPLTIEKFYPSDDPPSNRPQAKMSAKKQPGKAAVKLSTLLPQEIFKLLDQEISNQEAAKRSLSVVLYQHLKIGKEGKKMKAANTILIGPTGCGKSLIAKTLAGIVGLPYLKIDSSSLVQRGYRGGIHIDHIPEMLMAVAEGDKGLAEHGIIFIDEIDKIAFCNGEEGELSTIGVQHDLLSMIDGGKVVYEPEAAPEYCVTTFDFSQVLFIFAGAFQKLKKGDDITPGDLIRYGFIPEFANRLGNIIRIEALSDEVIKKLIRKEVEEYHAYLPMTSPEMNVYTELIHLMAMATKDYEKMGGRCVGPLVRQFFEERLFNLGTRS
jgi:ATP-dependent Clp protease ATP-binding subunit ClpX